jgi:hypothetical protein
MKGTGLAQRPAPTAPSPALRRANGAGTEARPYRANGAGTEARPYQPVPFSPLPSPSLSFSRYPKGHEKELTWNPRREG